jgi:hypothetical protein
VPEEQAHPAQHFGGGNYRRPGRFYSSTICASCVLDFAPRVRGGAMTIGNWGASRLQQIARDLYAPERGA